MAPASASLRTLVFTGQVSGARTRVDVADRRIWLTNRCLQLLIDLFLARANSASGYVRASAVSVLRLRQQLHAAIGTKRASEFIETAGNAYRLGIPREQLEHECGWTRCFSDLVVLRRISRAKLTRVKQTCLALPEASNGA